MEVPGAGACMDPGEERATGESRADGTPVSLLELSLALLSGQTLEVCRRKLLGGLPRLPRGSNGWPTSHRAMGPKDQELALWVEARPGGAKATAAGPGSPARMGLPLGAWPVGGGADRPVLGKELQLAV